MSKIIGLTGQSGAGKTAVSQVFARNGFGIINCDLLSRQVMQQGSDCNKKLAAFFPNCFDKAFKLDRQAMAQEVFSDSDKLKLLNSIVYPYINVLIESEAEGLSSEYQYILLDAPTLFEAGADKLCFKIVAVAADLNIRLKRVMLRDGIDKELILKRFNSQHDKQFFENNCDYVIYNNDDFSKTEKTVLEIIHKIKGK